MNLLSIGLGTLVLFLLAVSLCPAQEKIRTLEHGRYRQYDVATEPFAIVGRQLGDKPFINERQVAGNSDWLSKLILSVKNTSGKSIIAGEINLIIAKQNNMSADAAMILRFPIQESVLDGEGKATGEYQYTQPLKPGEVVKVRVPEGQLHILDVIKKDGVVDIDSVSVVFIRAIFDDRTSWFQGIEMKEDPNVPGRWIPVSRRPGD